MKFAALAVVAAITSPVFALTIDPSLAALNQRRQHVQFKCATGAAGGMI